MAPHSSPLHRVFLALGSNLSSAAGDPAHLVRTGLRSLLARLGSRTTLIATSSLYQTTPVGPQDQPAFINAAAALETPLAPDPLMELLLEVERSLGRVRDRPNGPRTLDLDLLLVDDLVLHTQTLTLPHPRLATRRFVLTPLCEIAPNLRHPILGKTISELLDQLPATGEQAPSHVRQLAGERL